MQSSSVIYFGAEKKVRSLSALQLTNLKYYFETEPNSDPRLHAIIKKEIKRRERNGEMYEDTACGK
jgi:hypothetical protein